MRPLSQLGTSDLLIPAIAGWLFTAVATAIFVAIERKFKIGQYIRAEGPAAHAGKASTPTMGGVCIWLITCIISIALLVTRDSYSFRALAVLAVSSGCALLGLIDDLTKFSGQSNIGVSGWLRLLIQLTLGAIFSALLLSVYGPDDVFSQLIGNVQGHIQAYYLVLPIACYLIFSAFVVAGSCNAVNLHDGLDGLAAGTSWQVFLCLALMLQCTRQPQCALVAAVAAGSILAFLLFNRHPAKIFMGDVGSLFLGALMATLAIAGHLIFWFIPLALIYIAETLSVIVQVSVFKLTKPYTPEKHFNPIYLFIFKLTHKLSGEGKRVFRMAPLHHHFEAVSAEKHIGESTIVTCFWLVQSAICLIVMSVFYWRFFS